MSRRINIILSCALALLPVGAALGARLRLRRGQGASRPAGASEPRSRDGSVDSAAYDNVDDSVPGASVGDPHAVVYRSRPGSPDLGLAEVGASSTA